jgi:AraC family transcriptional regulator, transcriptional activator of pobA
MLIENFIILFTITSFKTLTEGIPIYEMTNFRIIHRAENGEDFGCNLLGNLLTDGFELFSTDGQTAQIGPLKTDFFYVSLNLTGSVDIELNHFVHKHAPNTIFFKSPDKILSIDKPSKGYYGYYLLFTEKFIEKVVPNFNYLQQQFPFLSGGVSLFELNLDEAAEIKALILKMEYELRQKVSNREWMIGSYLFQLFITAHRSYTRQDYIITEQNRLHSSIFERFTKLVDAHYKNIHGVKEYADMLHVTPNHLNRLIKKQSQKTASSIIQDRLITEMKSLLKYSNKNISEIAFELNFTDVAHFSHYFKQATLMTPKAFRENA